MTSISIFKKHQLKVIVFLKKYLDLANIIGYYDNRHNYSSTKQQNL